MPLPPQLCCQLARGGAGLRRVYVCVHADYTRLLISSQAFALLNSQVSAFTSRLRFPGPRLSVSVQPTFC